MRVQILRARKEPHPAAADRTAMQRRILQATDPDRDVGAAFEQIDDLVVAVELQFDVGIARAIAVYERHDDMQHERRRGIDAQPSVLPHARPIR